jgi:hypothetical protein
MLKEKNMMEKFTETKMGRFAIETINSDFNSELTLLILSNTDKDYFSFIAERAIDIMYEVVDSNKDLNEIEVREITEKRVIYEIKETIDTFPNHSSIQETEYLLNNPINRKRLMDGIKQLKEGTTVKYTLEELKETIDTFPNHSNKAK